MTVLVVLKNIVHGKFTVIFFIMLEFSRWRNFTENYYQKNLFYRDSNCCVEEKFVAMSIVVMRKVCRNRNHRAGESLSRCQLLCGGKVCWQRSYCDENVLSKVFTPSIVQADMLPMRKFDVMKMSFVINLL